ncbi:hypothetical protein [Cochlodiniinecator piscidefendens]|nr:hypothetical protein [Cochlodiniinecator piscidefendens]
MKFAHLTRIVALVFVAFAVLGCSPSFGECEAEVEDLSTITAAVPAVC